MSSLVRDSFYGNSNGMVIRDTESLSSNFTLFISSIVLCGILPLIPIFWYMKYQSSQPIIRKPTTQPQNIPSSSSIQNPPTETPCEEFELVEFIDSSFYESNRLTVIKIKADGNCGYRAIARAMYPCRNNDEAYMCVKTKLVDCLKTITGLDRSIIVSSLRNQEITSVPDDKVWKEIINSYYGEDNKWMDAIVLSQFGKVFPDYVLIVHKNKMAPQRYSESSVTPRKEIHILYENEHYDALLPISEPIEVSSDKESYTRSKRVPTTFHDDTKLRGRRSQARRRGTRDIKSTLDYIQNRLNYYINRTDEYAMNKRFYFEQKKEYLLNQ